MSKKYIETIINKALILLVIISFNVCAQTAGVLDIGFNGTGYITALPIGPNARRADWPSIRSYLLTQCEMSLP
jgi:hypothetical protein